MVESGARISTDGEQRWQKMTADDFRNLSDEEFRRILTRLLLDDDYDGWLEVSVKKLNADASG